MLLPVCATGSAQAVGLPVCEDAAAARNRKQMEEMIEAYRDKFKSAKDEALKTEARYKAQIQIYTEELIKAQERYDGRPAREEDARKIAELGAALREARTAASRMADENGRFKAAVLDQEATLNRHFGAKPVVGALMPSQATSRSMTPRRASSVRGGGGGSAAKASPRRPLGERSAKGGGARR